MRSTGATLIDASDFDQALVSVEGHRGAVGGHDHQYVGAAWGESGVKLAHEHGSNPSPFPIGVDVDAVQLGLGAFAVVVEVARHLAVPLGDEEVRVVRARA